MSTNWMKQGAISFSQLGQPFGPAPDKDQTPIKIPRNMVAICPLDLRVFSTFEKYDKHAQIHGAPKMPGALRMLE